MTEYSFSRPDELPDPVPIGVVAKLLGVAAVTVYASCHRFLAAERSGDLDGMRRNVPCYVLGGRLDPFSGQPSGGRIIVPKNMLLAYHHSATLGLDAVKDLYGDDGGEAA
jgi:hypothetical protein